MSRDARKPGLLCAGVTRPPAGTGVRKQEPRHSGRPRREHLAGATALPAPRLVQPRTQAGTRKSVMCLTLSVAWPFHPRLLPAAEPHPVALSFRKRERMCGGFPASKSHHHHGLTDQPAPGGSPTPRAKDRAWQTGGALGTNVRHSVQFTGMLTSVADF